MTNAIHSFLIPEPLNLSSQASPWLPAHARFKITNPLAPGPYPAESAELKSLPGFHCSFVRLSSRKANPWLLVPLLLNLSTQSHPWLHGSLWYQVPKLPFLASISLSCDLLN